MAAQKIAYSEFETFIEENKNRLVDIIELAQQIENCFQSIEIDELWSGTNANAFFDASNNFFTKSSVVQNISIDSLRILDFLEKTLEESQTADLQASKMIGGSTSENI